MQKVVLFPLRICHVLLAAILVLTLGMQSLQDVYYLKKNTEHLFFNKCLMKYIQNVLFYDNENINHITKLCKFVNETDKKMHSKVWKSAVGTKLPT